MLYKIISLSSLFTLLILTLSCEKVVDIDLNSSNPKPVFEAYMENDSTCYVKASWTSSYYDNSSSPVIPNAVITIADDNGNNENLTYQGNGIYKGNTMLGTIGRTYTLNIDLDGNQYSAQSTMPPLTPIDSTSTLFSAAFGQNGYFLFMNYTDDGNVTNYYATRATYWDDEEKEYVTQYGIADDNISNGTDTRTFAGFRLYEAGDTVSVELASIDKATHLYFKTLEDAISGAGFAAAAPANPTTNFSGGALGYFGAWSKDTETVVVQ